jgi:hypothetical protein
MSCTFFLRIDEEKKKDDWLKKLIGGRRFFLFGMIDGQVCSNS